MQRHRILLSSGQVELSTQAHNVAAPARGPSLLHRNKKTQLRQLPYDTDDEAHDHKNFVEDLKVKIRVWDTLALN